MTTDSTSRPSPHAGHQGVGLKVPTLQSHGLVLLATYSHPQTWSKSHFIDITKDTFIALLPENSKGFSSSVPEMGMKTKYIFLVRNHNITTLFGMLSLPELIPFQFPYPWEPLYRLLNSPVLPQVPPLLHQPVPACTVYGSRRKGKKVKVNPIHSARSNS